MVFRLLISTIIGVSAGVMALHASAATTQSLEAELKQKPNRVSIREALGRAYFKKKQYQKTIELLAPYSNEISSDSLILLSEAYANADDHLNELRMLQQYVDKEPNRFRPHYLLGLAQWRNKKLDDASQNLRRSVELAPKHRPSYDTLLQIFIEKKQNYESRILLNDMIREFGPKKEFLALSCKLNAAGGFINEAIADCKKAIHLDPRHPDNHIYLAQAYYDKENRPAAEKIFITSARQFPKSEFVQYATGEYYLNEKNFPAAVRYLTAAVKVNPNTMRAQLTLGEALFESRDFTRALEHYNKACQLDKTKDSISVFKRSAAKIRQMNMTSLAEQYDRKIAICQP